jgi:hypothetical protein
MHIRHTSTLRSAESQSGGSRDYEDIMLRRVPAAAHRFRLPVAPGSDAVRRGG